MRRLPVAVLLLATSACIGPSTGRSGSAHDLAPTSTHVVALDEVAWSPLNPARGSAGPQAANLWGDRTGAGPSGFLVQFVDGFASPPHIHNVSYRAVVLAGELHNDHPDAPEVWLPPGSSWTQPWGEVHITAARGERNLAYVEIETGPYLVLPVEEAVESGEAMLRSPASDGEPVPGIVHPWGSAQDGMPHGTLVTLPPGYRGILRGRGPALHALVIHGRAWHRSSPAAYPLPLEPGTSFSSAGETDHHLACDTACTLYVRTDGAPAVVPAPGTPPHQGPR